MAMITGVEPSDNVRMKILREAGAAGVEDLAEFYPENRRLGTAVLESQSCRSGPVSTRAHRGWTRLERPL